MAATSARTLKLLSIFGIGLTLTAGELATRLGTSVRTVRRDIDTLRELGYEIEAVRGAGGGYRLGRATRLPPVVFDEDQAVAAAVALQTVPTILDGVRENAARALATLRQAMPARSRAHAEAFTVSAARNYWEFPAAPIDAEIIRVIGGAIRRQHVIRLDYSGGDAPATLTLEPHDLVVWAARWYLVAFEPEADRWRAMRVDRLEPRMPTGRTFDRRDVPHGDPVAFVMSTHDRGDIPADWPCRGSALIALPAPVVARFAPGGSTVEHHTDSSCRLTLGAWSWAGVAGLLLTFDADVTDIEPAELRQTLRSLRTRIDDGLRAGEDSGGSGAPSWLTGHDAARYRVRAWGASAGTYGSGGSAGGR
ncbi:helix-turn-helix transcriptional regulator [Streptomyces collinus]|uniref:DNA-binding transcriptional regulator YafY n=2 Tax=Streptomyces TaxID=1883 RepID=A0AA89QAI4_STRCU|nr:MULTISPECIES: WYL domain-containing protein [Streptomyces]MBB5812540.1 putative DNA-binding transcriptional regulator YafY [Streptomyces collinus]MEC7055393.1 WYL domain-containing protein [Streptomyces violaceochromogenes]WMX65685.1 WYL domain-containing protein [Streptomyces collinus]GHC73013.1 DeoR family transcriptional regulator [Streptomyces violaceochromogenes]